MEHQMTANIKAPKNRARAKRIDNTGGYWEVPKENRWRAQFYDATGTLRNLSARSEQEISDRLDMAIRERDKGFLGPAPQGIPTLGEWLDTWLDSKYQLKAKTVARYRTDIELYIKPNLGGVRLDQLKAPAFQALFAKLSRENGLSPLSIKHVRSTLSAALNQAFDYEVIPMLIMKKVKAPKVPEIRREIIDPQTVERILDVAAQAGISSFIRWKLAFSWGLRQGEALGLRWQDINFETRKISIVQQMQYFPGEGMKVGTPKGSKGQREFTLDRSTITALRKLRTEQLSIKLAASDWVDNDLIFCTTKGKPIDAANDRRRFKSFLSLSNSKDFRVHDARHTAITNMVMDGTNLATVQKIAGHSDIRTTMLYVHATSESFESAALAVEARMG